jgi:hypothetical protein
MKLGNDERKSGLSNCNWKERGTVDADDLKGIRYALVNKFGIKVVTPTQVVIVSTLIKNPGMRAFQVGKLLEKSHGFSMSGTFKAYKKLKDYDVIDNKGHIQFKSSDMIPRINGERISYPLVSFVRERVMPEDAFRYEWTHIAAYIATLPNPIEVCEAIRKVTDPVEMLPLLYEMQNGLAFCSVMAGDVSQWVEMKGTIQFLTTFEELFKKAGIKI